MTRTLTLELEDEVAARAEEISKATGRSVSEVVSELLSNLLYQSKPGGPRKSSARQTYEMDNVPLLPDSGIKSGRSSRPAKTATNPRTGDLHKAAGIEPEAVSSSGDPKEIPGLTPIVKSLIGILKGSGLDEEDYYRHLEEKYL
jgi:hypothetical protein